MPATGGEAQPVTADPTPQAPGHESVIQFEWRPDGKAIAFTAVPSNLERQRRKRQKDDAYRWRVDHDYAQLFQVELDPTKIGPNPQVGKARPLTHGPFHVESLTWHPNGHSLAFLAQDTPFIDSWPSSRLMTVNIADPDAEPATLAVVSIWKATIAFSPDGAWIACQKGIEENRWPYAGRMHIFPAQPHADTDARALADVSDAQPGLIGWTSDSRHVLVLNDRGLGTEVIALPVDGGPGKTLVENHMPCTFAHLTKSGLLCLVRQHHHIINGVEVVQVDLADDAAVQPATPRRVATPHQPEFPQGALPQVRELRWSTPDGLEIEGILYLPADYDAESGEKLPLLLHIHGGPMGVFQAAFSGLPYYYTPTAFCELGCAVLRANPRGSSGYGKEFRFANILDWGEGDYRDLMQGVDTVLEMGIADPDRLGVCGWSYGGFMSSWVITQTHRFQAASIGAPVTNPISFNATADIPSFIPDFYGGEAWEAESFYRDHSPLVHAHNVRTPAIIQHGDADTRVPLEQGLQFYHVLSRIQVPVELFVYPRQGHAILEPRLLIDAMQRNLTWFSQRLNLRDFAADDVGSEPNS
jgi:dipeptidyl aminopeptidase/acylaminoacyl peptidase